MQGNPKKERNSQSQCIAPSKNWEFIFEHGTTWTSFVFFTERRQEKGRLQLQIKKGNQLYGADEGALFRDPSAGARSQVRVLLLHSLKSQSTREIYVTVLSCEDILSLHARPRAADVPNNKSEAKNYQSLQTSQAERIAIWSKKWFGIITVVPTVKTQHARKHSIEQTTTFCTAKQDFTKTHLPKLTVISLLLYRHRICQVTE